jgi:hypothetical protein
MGKSDSGNGKRRVLSDANADGAVFAALRIRWQMADGS